MQERIPKILIHADAFIFLIGDLTFLSWVHLNIHQKLIGLLNVNIFYDDLITFINNAIKNHFISFTVKKLFVCAPTNSELLDLLEAYKTGA